MGCWGGTFFSINHEIFPIREGMKSKITFKGVYHFFEEKIWDPQLKLPWWKDIPFDICRFIYLVLTGITKNKTAVRATALAYTTLLSIVPLIAVMMAFIKAFGGFEKIQAWLNPLILDNLATGSGEIVRKYLVEFIQNLHAGTLGVVAIGLLILTVVGLLSTIETAFNDIWGVKQSRPFMRRLMAYWTLVTIGPLFVAISIGSTATLQSSHFVQTYLLGNELIHTGLKLMPYVMTWTLFTMLYSFMPNTRVHFRSALLGGILAGTLWELAKYGYTVYAASSVQYSMVYGSLGVLPVFLIWLYLTWVIVLVGAEISFAHQNIATYREEKKVVKASQEFKEFLALNLVTYIGSHYEQHKGAVTAQALILDFKIPPRLINDVLFTLCVKGILLEMGEEEHYYCPARPLERITVKNILDSLRSVGEVSPRFGFTQYEKYFKRLLSDIDKTFFDISGNKNFKDIIHEISPPFKK